MFSAFKQIFKPKNKDIRKRILFTLMILFIYKLGTIILIPGIDKSALNTNSLGFLELLNVMGGGALADFSIFALGVMPYITASIVMQILQMDIIPYFSELSKQGQTGRNKINQITRVVGIAFAFVQGYILSLTFIKGGSALDYMQIAVVMTAGTALLLWLSDRITSSGIGNGVSLIIMAGIISSLPKMFSDAYSVFVVINTSSFGIVAFILFVLAYLGILVAVIYTQLAERRLPIQYANISSSNLGRQNYIPLKLNSAGVTPVIFASALVSIPGLIAQVIGNEWFSLFVTEWLALNTWTGLLLYVILIFGFTYLYTFLTLKPADMAEDLQKSGGYLPGIRPGEKTAEYITNVLKKVTFVGAITLVLIAGLPIVFSMLTKLPQSISIGGTGLLIVVGVALETYKEIESKLVSRTYTKSTGRRRR